MFDIFIASIHLYVYVSKSSYNYRSASEADTYPGGRTESECEASSLPSIDSPHSCFRKLRFLNLNSTLLATWDDVERLSRFPALQCLRLQGCPLFEVRGSCKVLSAIQESLKRALLLEAVSTSEMSVSFYETTQSNFPGLLYTYEHSQYITAVLISFYELLTLMEE
jgi:hypothetical protein